MDSVEDREWKSKYLIDPLNAPEPNQETGLGSHFRSPSTKKGPIVTTSSYPSPPSSASPTQSTFSSKNPYAHRQKASAEHDDAGPSQRKNSGGLSVKDEGRRRGSSLGQRYEGDLSHRPLDQIRKDVKAANRAPHLKKKHIPGADIIDSLDSIGGQYHHGGPYDATLLARNTSHQSSPVEAVRTSIAEALRATPQDKIRDSLDRHVPLQGVAVIPPGMRDLSGEKMVYEEGADLMREQDAPGGAYKRTEGVKYLPDDFKGKGEPSFSLEKALKEHKISSHRRIMSDGDSAYEMRPRSRPTGSLLRTQSGPDTELNSKPHRESTRNSDLEGNVGQSHSTGRKVGEGLKKRFGSLRRSKKTTEG